MVDGEMTYHELTKEASEMISWIDTEFSALTFSRGSADLEPLSCDRLGNLVGLLDEDSTLYLRINGSSCNVESTNLQNLRISAIIQHLGDRGIPSQRIFVSPLEMRSASEIKFQIGQRSYEESA